MDKKHLTNMDRLALESFAARQLRMSYGAYRVQLSPEQRAAYEARYYAAWRRACL